MTLAEVVIERLGGSGPHLVGVGGPVAVGKTRIAEELVEALRSEGRRALMLSTDAFLFDNARLSAKGTLHRKGFPETYDAEALDAALGALRSGDLVRVPVYSHATYDIVPGEFAVYEAGDVVVVDGVVALNVPARDHLDVAVYVHADEGVVRGWFVERFLGFVGAARTDPSSFYATFAEMDAEEVRGVAESVWDSINGPNLREHIEATRGAADVVVHKDVDHSIIEVEVR